MQNIRNAIALTLLRRLTLVNRVELFRLAGSTEDIFSLDTYEGKLNPCSLTKLKEVFAEKEAALHKADRIIELSEKMHLRLMTMEDEDYPTRLLHCPDAPLVLSYYGNAPLNEKHVVSIVGTRKITRYGVEWCAQFCADLAKRVPDCIVVSGLAYGVDINAHRGALKNGLSTIGVLAHGLTFIYPSCHRDTAANMVQHGGLLSEFYPEDRADKKNFLQRNRIIAGCSDATIIVESAKHGGAINTASSAGSYHREVFALPGRSTDRYSEGCNNLLRDNKASLITSADDFINAMGWENDEQHPREESLFPTLPPLSEEELKLCENLIGSDGKSINTLITELNSNYSNLSALLIKLEMEGIISTLPGGRYKLSAASQVWFPG